MGFNIESHIGAVKPSVSSLKRMDIALAWALSLKAARQRLETCEAPERTAGDLPVDSGSSS